MSGSVSGPCSTLGPGNFEEVVIWLELQLCQRRTVETTKLEQDQIQPHTKQRRITSIDHLTPYVDMCMSIHMYKYAFNACIVDMYVHVAICTYMNTYIYAHTSVSTY